MSDNITIDNITILNRYLTASVSVILLILFMIFIIVGIYDLRSNYKYKNKLLKLEEMQLGIENTQQMTNMDIYKNKIDFINSNKTNSEFIQNLFYLEAWERIINKTNINIAPTDLKEILLKTTN